MVCLIIKKTVISDKHDLLGGEESSKKSKTIINLNQSNSNIR